MYRSALYRVPIDKLKTLDAKSKQISVLDTETGALLQPIMKNVRQYFATWFNLRFTLARKTGLDINCVGENPLHHANIEMTRNHYATKESSNIIIGDGRSERMFKINGQGTMEAELLKREDQENKNIKDYIEYNAEPDNGPADPTLFVGNWTEDDLSIYSDQ